MRWKPHVRFGERTGETDQPKDRHRAPVRLHTTLRTSAAVGRVLDAFHVVRLGIDTVDEVRRWVEHGSSGSGSALATRYSGSRRLLRRGCDRYTNCTWTLVLQP